MPTAEVTSTRLDVALGKRVHGASAVVKRAIGGRPARSSALHNLALDLLYELSKRGVRLWLWLSSLQLPQRWFLCVMAGA